MSNEKQLTDKQEMFVIEYLKCFNATKAAKAAGYSEKTAYSIGSELLNKPEVTSRIRAYMEKHAMSAHEVLFHLGQIARGDMDDIIDSKGSIDMFKAREAGRTNLIKRVKTKSITTADKDGEGSDIFESDTEAYDRMKALELIGKYHAMFTDKMQVVDWRSQAIDDIRANKYTHDEIAALFGDETLATQLFAEAGKSVTVGGE
jgi:phage terminase small subunit